MHVSIDTGLKLTTAQGLRTFGNYAESQSVRVSAEIREGNLVINLNWPNWEEDEHDVADNVARMIRRIREVRKAIELADSARSGA